MRTAEQLEAEIEKLKRRLSEKKRKTAENERKARDQARYILGGAMSKYLGEHDEKFREKVLKKIIGDEENYKKVKGVIDSEISKRQAEESGNETEEHEKRKGQEGHYPS